MPKFDLIMITTVAADTYNDACNWLRDFADGIADQYRMPITSEHPGMAAILPNGQRVYVLMPLTTGEGASGIEGITDERTELPGPYRD